MPFRGTIQRTDTEEIILRSFTTHLVAVSTLWQKKKKTKTFLSPGMCTPRVLSWANAYFGCEELQDFPSHRLAATQWTCSTNPWKWGRKLMSYHVVVKYQNRERERGKHSNDSYNSTTFKIPAKAFWWIFCSLRFPFNDLSQRTSYVTFAACNRYRLEEKSDKTKPTISLFPIRRMLSYRCTSLRYYSKFYSTQTEPQKTEMLYNQERPRCG